MFIAELSAVTMEWEPIPFEEGMLARMRGVPEGANPYRSRGSWSNFDSWAAGWADGDRFVITEGKRC